MNDQPKPTGEWTAERLLDELNNPVVSHEALAWTVKQINAALDAEREKWIKLCDKTSDNATKAEQQLAAEREKLKLWEEGEMPMITLRHMASLVTEVQHLREQLAAEKEKVNVLEYAIGCLRVSEKTLVKALEEIATGSEASGDSLRRYAANEIARLNQ